MNAGVGLSLEKSFRVRCYQPQDLQMWQAFLRRTRIPPTEEHLLNIGADLVWEEEFRNAWNTTSLNDLLSVYFASGTQKPNWFFGLVDNAGFAAFNSTDTIAAHAGWAENQDYTSGTRVAWTPGAPAGGAIANPIAATVTMNAGATIKGAFLASESTKGGATGVLCAAGAFASNQVLVNGQVLTLTYQVPLTAL